MNWLNMQDMAGVLLPAVVPLVYAVHRLHATGELYLRARIELEAEREQRVTMTEVAAVIPDGGAAARFEEGAPVWLVVKAPDPVSTVFLQEVR